MLYRYYILVSKPGNPLDAAGLPVGINFCRSRNIFPTVECHAFLDFYYNASGCDDEEMNENALIVGNNLMEILFHKNFELGIQLNTIDKSNPNASVMAVCAAEAGVPASIIESYYSQSIDKKQALLRQVNSRDAYAKDTLRVNGVPYVILQNQNANSTNNKLAFSGGQPIETIVQYLQKAYKP